MIFKEDTKHFKMDKKFFEMKA